MFEGPGPAIPVKSSQLPTPRGNSIDIFASAKRGATGQQQCEVIDLMAEDDKSPENAEIAT